MDTTSSSVKKGPILIIMILGAFLATLNQTVMSVATPELMIDFNISATTAQWLTTGYMLVNGILIPITAYFMQRFSTRQLFQASMMIFLVGTIVSALAVNFPVLLTGRMIQAAGAGIIMPLLTNVILVLFPPEKRGAAMGMMGLAIIFAPAIGPTLAGYILENFKWQTMFYGMIPLAVIVIICGFIYLKNVSETVRSKMDIISVVLSTVAFGTLLYGFSQAGSQGWSSAEVLVSIAVGVIALVLFVWRQLVSKKPLLDLRAFKYNMFSLTTAINIMVTMVMYADMMLLPLYLQNARGYSALESGLLMLPGALVMGLLMPVTGRLFDRFGAKWLAVAGLIITIATTAGFINLTDHTTYAYLLFMSTGRRIGMALLMMPIQTAGLNQLPARLNAHGTAISNTVRQVAGAVGTSLLVTVMSDRTKTHLTDMMASGGAAANQKQMVLEATIQGINDAYVVIIGIGIVGLLLSFFIKRTSRNIEHASEAAIQKGVVSEA
ncbi:DHA2 family efflux MFS transporter permease subunit [Paenibacillus favisporus]